MNTFDLRKLSPHVDTEWGDALVTELRLQGVSGSGIGASLSEVESHCAESGASAPESFGDPVAYARSLNLPVDPRQEPAAIARTVGPVVAQVAGMMLALAALRALLDDEAVAVHVGDVVWAMAFLAIVAALVLAPGRLLRALVTRPLYATAAVTTVMGLLFIPAALRSELGRVPAWPVAVIGVLLLVGGVVVGWRAGGGEAADPVTSPAVASGPASARSDWVVRPMVPVAAVVLALLHVVLR